MQTLSPIRFGFALGMTGALFYVSCMAFMAIAPDAVVIWIFNGLLHGIDITSILRESVPFTQAVAGIASTLLGGFLFGAIAAWGYNWGLGSATPKGD